MKGEYQRDPGSNIRSIWPSRLWDDAFEGLGIESNASGGLFRINGWARHDEQIIPSDFEIT